MDAPDTIAALVAAGLGLASWGFVEYLIHGILSHRFRTFVSPLHWSHHREPRAVFTSPVAWVPVAGLLYLLAALLAGPFVGGGFLLGLLAGFAHYERSHWRFHFRAPRSERERRLRAHHLAHHFRNPKVYHGVTTRLWDRIFRTLPATWPEDYAAVTDLPPLQGPSNLAASWNPRTALAPLRNARVERRAPEEGPGDRR